MLSALLSSFMPAGPGPAVTIAGLIVAIGIAGVFAITVAVAVAVAVADALGRRQDDAVLDSPRPHQDLEIIDPRS